MAVISQAIFQNAFSWMDFIILIKISLRFFRKGPIEGNNPVLV